MARGPTAFLGFGRYWQPSLVAFDDASDTVVAGGQDSGIFLSLDDGSTWSLVSDPFTPGISGTPHLPRPWYAYFDSEGDINNVYIGTRGWGVWRLKLPMASIFADGFEAGDESGWSTSVP